MIFKSPKKTFLIGLLLTFIVGGFLFFTSSVFGQDTFGTQVVEDEIILGSDDIRVTIVRIINTLLGLLGIIALGIVMYGGFMYMTAAGAEDKIATARKILINGTIGLVIILSAFAITRFVLNRLIDATGAGTSVVERLEGSCDEPGTPYYEKYNGTRVCDSFCSLYPSQCCYAQSFLVKSITPSTPSLGDQTSMYNVVVRALFSRQVAGPANEVFKVFEKNGTEKTDITSDFDFAYDDTGTVVEATYNKNACGSHNGIDDYCLLPGEYEVLVGDVRDLEGNELEETTSCGDFPKNASFRTGVFGYDTLEIKSPAAAGEASDENGYVVVSATRVVYEDGGRDNAIVKDEFCEWSGNWMTSDDLGGIMDVGEEYSYDDGGNMVTVTTHVARADDPSATVRCAGINNEEYEISFHTYIPGVTLLQPELYVSDAYYTLTTAAGTETHAVNLNAPAGTWRQVGGAGHTIVIGAFEAKDEVAPVISSFTLDNRAGGNTFRLIQGINYPIASVLTDNRGNAYGDLSVFKETDDTVLFKRFIDGPHVSVGSRGDFDMSYGFRVPYDLEFDTNYVAEIRAHDIDSNEATDRITFKVVPDYCADPEREDEPICRGRNTGASCEVQADCAEWLKCLDTDTTLCEVGDTQCVCTESPYIESVEPLDGAEGNWVTIKGLGFGEEAGDIGFNYIDANSDGDYEDAGDTQAVANIAECRNDVWTDTWIIAEVPPQEDVLAPDEALLMNGTDTYVSVPYNMENWGLDDSILSVEAWIKPPADGIIPRTLI
ncbi:hypothetical protein C0581_04830, partial [Candidatus Parcubacteria bacterium]